MIVVELGAWRSTSLTGVAWRSTTWTGAQPPSTIVVELATKIPLAIVVTVAAQVTGTMGAARFDIAISSDKLILVMCEVLPEV
nr:hypothetical protein Iba_chr06aCG15230 [Ipomoea batatas]